MKIEVLPARMDDVLPLRELHRQEMNCQIINDSFPRRGLSDPYLLTVDGHPAGYGLMATKYHPDTLTEFYTFPDHRSAALPLFHRLLAVSRAKKIRAQTNDRLLLLMLYDCATRIRSEAILFEDAFTSHLTCPEGALKAVTAADRSRLAEQQLGPDNQWMIESDGVPVAAGQLLFHYNPPYADLAMEVHEGYRRRGLGSYLVQELKRIAYEIGKRPAARCNVENEASRRTLQKAGLLPCGRVLLGPVIPALRTSG